MIQVMSAGENQIIILDDHVMVATALADVLQTNHGIRVVGTTRDVAGALALLDLHRVDLVVLDLRLADGQDATLAIPQILQRSPATRVLVLSAYSDDWSVARAVEAGCHGYLVKDQSIGDLVAAIDALLRGEAVFGPSVLHRVLKLLRPGPSSPETLTPRETEVLQRLADGMPTDQIAADLFVSVNTVRNHIHNVIRKLNVHSRLEAVSTGIRNGLIQVR